MSELKAEMFDGVRSYRAFLYAIDVFEQLERMQKEGYLFFCGDNFINDYFFVDKLNLEAGTKRDHCTCLVVGCNFGGENIDKPYLTKGEINEYTRNLRIISPEDIDVFKLDKQE